MNDALIAVRVVHFAATAMTAGILIFLSVVAQRGFGEAHATAAAIAFRTRSQRLIWAGLAITVISGVVWIALQASAMSGLPLDETISGDVVWIVLSKTHFGMVSDFRCALAVLLAACLPLAGCRSWIRWIPPALGAGLAATIAWTGHAAATLGLVGTLHLIADSLHVLASSAWIGGLVPLAMLLAAASRQDDFTWAMIARNATLRFSNLGIASVGTLLATGVVNAWILVGSFRALVGTDYGCLVLVKIGLFAAMVSVATFNRLRLTPRLSGTRLQKQELGRLSRNSIIEIVMGLAVFAVVGVLGTLHPAIHLVLP